MGREESGSGAVVPDKLAVPAMPSVASLAHGRCMVNICSRDMSGKSTGFYFVCVCFVLACPPWHWQRIIPVIFFFFFGLNEIKLKGHCPTSRTRQPSLILYQWPYHPRSLLILPSTGDPRAHSSVHPSDSQPLLSSLDCTCMFLGHPRSCPVPPAATLLSHHTWSAF